jgi:hypothetical protein
MYVLQLPKRRGKKRIGNLSKIEICASLIPFKQLWMVANLPSRK